jgi:hypothetical protein
MNTKNILHRLPLVSILLISIVLGTIVGSGAALADDDYFNLSVGWNYLSGTHADDGWGYNFAHWESMSSDRTRVDIDDTYYTNGWDTPPWTAKFGVLTVYDAYGRDYQDYYTFLSQNVENCNTYADTNLTMDELDEDDDVVVCQQRISYGVTFSDNVFASTGY